MVQNQGDFNEKKKKYDIDNNENNTNNDLIKNILEL